MVQIRSNTDDWDLRAPLNETQQQSIEFMREIYEESTNLHDNDPINKELCVDLNHISLDTSSLMSSTKMELKEWFKWWRLSWEKKYILSTHGSESLENEMYQINLELDSCNQILFRLEASRDLVECIEGHYAHFLSTTKPIQDSYETLWKEQNRLTQLQTEIQKKMCYFNHLTESTKVLTSSGKNIVLHDSFLPMLEQIDDSINFLRIHSSYIDADIYLIKYNQCMVRSLSLLKMHISETFKAIQQEVQSRLNGQNVILMNASAQNALFYIKFKTVATKLKILVNELEKRVDSKYAGKSAQSLLNDCLKTYFQVRYSLVSIWIKAKLASFIVTLDLSNMARNGLSFLKNLCFDELNLFRQFFSQVSFSLLDFLTRCVNELHDFLRPRIIHESNLEVLSDLCEILRIDTMKPPIKSNIKFGVDTEADSEAIEIFLGISQSILEDAQQRLIFRSSLFISQEILNFAPNDENFDYITRIQSHNKEIRDFEGAVSVSFQQLWYPTVSRSLNLLSKLYRSIKTEVFEDFSEEIVSSCIYSLKSASSQIEEKRSKEEGCLFLIFNLYVLREQIAPFDVQFIRTDKLFDFAILKEAASAILREKMSIFRLTSENALLALVHEAFPKVVVETLVDARKEVELQLNDASDFFVSLVVAKALVPIENFCSSASLNTNPETKEAFFIYPEKIYEDNEALLRLQDTFKDETEAYLASIHLLLSDYLFGTSLVQIIFSSIQSKFIQNIQCFYQAIHSLTVRRESIESLEKSIAVILSSLQSK